MDDILLEVRRVREAYAEQFGYDLQAIHRDLKAQEQASGRRIIALPPRRPKLPLVRGGNTSAADSRCDAAEVRPVSGPPGDSLAVIAAMEAEPHLSADDVAELQRAIASGKRPAPAIDPFAQDTPGPA